jgi:hypothetical protein
MGNNVFLNSHEDLIIYAEVASRPDGWNTNFNPNNRPVVWDLTSRSPRNLTYTGTTLSWEAPDMTGIRESDIPHIFSDYRILRDGNNFTNQPFGQNEIITLHYRNLHCQDYVYYGQYVYTVK